MSLNTTAIPLRAKAIVCERQGDVEELQLKEVDVRSPGPNEILMRVEYSGVNFIDIYNRNGIYAYPVPLVIGNEPAGEIVAVGSNVRHLAVGDKAVSIVGGGGYAEYFCGPADLTAKLPDGVSTKLAATSFLQGITALTNALEAHPVKKGEYVLIHAAAGGVGKLLLQLCHHIGAFVIGTTSTPEKAALAKKAGADEVVLYGNRSMADVVKDVKALTPGGEGVHAVFDGVGKDTFESDFVVARRKATIVLLGAASGPVPPFPPMWLQPKSLKLIRPGCGAYIATLPEFITYAEKLFETVQTGVVKIALWKDDGYEFTTEGVQQSHRDLASRGTTGKLFLKVFAK